MIRKKTYIIFYSFFLMVLWCSKPALSQEHITYEQNLKPSVIVMVSEFVKKEFQKDLEHYEIALVDLNGDALNEYIIKTRNCWGTEEICNFFILAEIKLKPFVLGEIQAKSLALGNTYSSGVQDILAFRNNNNDYDYVVYIWDSTSKQYILKEQTAGY